MNSKILVTGGDGFIGSHLVEELVRQGRSVRVFCCYNSFNSWGWLDKSDPNTRDKIEVILGDIRDRYCVTEAMRGCDSVMHLAALIAIPYSYVAAEAFVDVNVKGTLNVVEAARQLGVKKVVHTSTSETYGTAQFVPISEEHPLVGQSPYAASKIGADQIAMSYWRSFDVPVATVRPFNTYGPRQSLRAVIPTVLCQLIDGATKLKLGAASPRRDFNFIEDTVSGMIAILDSEKSIGETINIGNGYDISIGDMVDICMEITSNQVEIETEEQRIRPEASEVERLLCSNEKAKTLLGWEPKYHGHEGLRNGLAKYAEWLMVRENRQSYVNTDRYVI
ncbi:NAD-dependent 4,6-dehydratase LegB [Curvivirga aplysinae]|uniref:NAD-dependent 4,6-dehydratase LegB n=1 Tax=Curvivirga aplysinae TaxID=2529852 RepID=UPI0012BB8D91|nr:NAD-dependent 4,6-dehydratase LegB [Curvivirga aplysinae]MTI11388.1 SDR family NAD(P)-dependent oxidoreductase [Curvivirga aplysinae]